MKLLIVGCPHSGTMFTAEVLRASGITSCGHEAIYTLHDGYVPKNDALIEVSWEATLHLGTPAIPPNTIIGHLVRDPIAWLNSWLRMLQRGGAAAWALLSAAYPEIDQMNARDPRVAAMYLWVTLNQRCARYTPRRFRAEDLRGPRGVQILSRLCSAAKIDLDETQARRALEKTDAQMNHHQGLPSYVASTWGSLPRGDTLDHFRRLARSYGYPEA